MNEYRTQRWFNLMPLLTCCYILAHTFMWWHTALIPAFMNKFTGHLLPYKSHDIGNVVPRNMGMSQLLFLVATRAICIYALSSQNPVINPVEPKFGFLAHFTGEVIHSRFETAPNSKYSKYSILNTPITALNIICIPGHRANIVRSRQLGEHFVTNLLLRTSSWGLKMSLSNRE